MDLEKGIGYCGLACCTCGNSDNCPGCRNNGCSSKEWCKHFSCCQEKGLDGCWECHEFPCSGGMFDKRRIRTFAKFIAEYGEGALVTRLQENEKSGIVYHYKGQVTGDYDRPASEEGIINLILTGRKERDTGCWTQS